MTSEATTPLGRAVLALRNAQDASDKLSAFLAKRADAEHYVLTIAADLATELALLEASLLAAQPALNSHQIELGAKPAESANLWLNLDGVRA